MFQNILSRIHQGHRTIPYPKEEPVLPDRFRGLPIIDASQCTNGCRECAEACPTNAINITQDRMSLDLGRCLFCSDCTKACPAGAIRYTQEYRLATRTRQDLILEGEALKLAEALDEKSLRLFGRSLKLREVSAGGCNGCEADLNVLSTVVFDLGRFGIQFVASLRHADGIVITGPVSENMRTALLDTYAAVPHQTGHRGRLVQSAVVLLWIIPKFIMVVDRFTRRSLYSRLSPSSIDDITWSIAIARQVARPRSLRQETFESFRHGLAS